MKTNGTSLAAIIAESGPMEERKAMGIARVLCGRLIEEAAAEESALAMAETPLRPLFC